MTVEGLAHEALDFIRAHPDMKWTTDWRAWADRLQLERRWEREVRAELARLREVAP
jgi:hypothetical protein